MMTESERDAARANSSAGAIPSDQSLAAWEIASLVASSLIAEWILAAAAGRTRLIVAIPITLAFVLVISSHFLRRESLRELGFRFDNFLQAMKLLALPMIIVALLSLGL